MVESWVEKSDFMNNKKNKLIDWLYIVLGNFILATGVAVFVLPNNILTGGVSGIAVALQPVCSIPPVWIINGLTIGLFIVGAFVLGKKFAMKSLVSSFLYPGFVTLIGIYVASMPEGTFVFPEYLASIYSGVFLGVGIGMVFRADASTGGMDIPALILAKYTNIKLGDATMLIDALTVLLGIITYGLEPALVGIISVVISGVMINRTVIFGTQSARKVMIISEKHEEIKQYILRDMDRGLTVLEARGGFTNESRPVLMLVIENKEYPALEREVSMVDPKAFIIVDDVHEIRGSGFTFPDGSL